MSSRPTRKRIGRIVAALLALYLVVAYLGPRLRWVRTQSALSVTAGSVPTSKPAGTVFAGVIAVHTRRSHDAIGSETEVAEAARAAGLDFVVLTDHRSGSAPDSLWQLPARYEEGVLVVRGQEISLGPEVGRVLIFGLDTAVTRWDGGLEALGRRLEAAGATAIVAHSRSPRVRDSWRPRTAPGIAGWEVFDLADVGRARLGDPWVLYHLIALAVNAPLGRSHESLLRLHREGFEQPAVAAFDSLHARQDLTAVAGLDAHPKLRVGGRLFPGYEPLFKTLVNHVTLAGPLPAQAEEAAAALAAALRLGRVHISFGDAGTARSFRLRLEAPEPGTREQPGRRIWSPGLRLSAGFGDASPSRTVYRVVRDGTPAAWLRGPAIAWPVPAAGSYRVEVYRYTARVGPLHWNFRPWVFSNPLRVTAATDVALERL